MKGIAGLQVVANQKENLLLQTICFSVTSLVNCLLLKVAPCEKTGDATREQAAHKLIECKEKLTRCTCKAPFATANSPNAGTHLLLKEAASLIAMERSKSECGRTRPRRRAQRTMMEEARRGTRGEAKTQLQ
jgi:hypothetical protein